MVDRMEDRKATHRVAHADQALLAGVPDHQGKIAFKALEAFEPALAVDRKSQRGIAVFCALARLGRRQPSAQIRAVVEPTHQHGAHPRNCRLHHKGRTIVVTVVAQVELGLTMSSEDGEPNSHGTSPWGSGPGV